VHSHLSLYCLVVVAPDSVQVISFVGIESGVQPLLVQPFSQ